MLCVAMAINLIGVFLSARIVVDTNTLESMVIERTFLLGMLALPFRNVAARHLFPTYLVQLRQSGMDCSSDHL